MGADKNIFYPFSAIVTVGTARIISRGLAFLTITDNHDRTRSDVT